MKQYCRNCIHAKDYHGEGMDYFCTAEAPCGGNGAGRMYRAARAKRPNQCKAYCYGAWDIFLEEAIDVNEEESWKWHDLFYYYRKKNDRRARIAITITALAAMVSVAALVIRLLSLGRG